MSQPASPVETPSAGTPVEKNLLFPGPDVVDEVVYNYLRRADKMGWSPYDLIDTENVRDLARTERLTAEQFSATKTVLFVEDHLPGYLAEYIRLMTDPDLPDENLIVNKSAMHYVMRWVGEEDRHAHVLEMYLTKTGLMDSRTLSLEMLRERKVAYVPPAMNMEDTFVYLGLQEKATQMYYKALAKDINEPLLKTILNRMGADEASHAAFFYELLIKSNKGDLDRLARKVTKVTNEFKMPVQSNLQNYRRQVLNMMRAAPSYKHPDVFQDMMKAIDKASTTYSRDALNLIMPDVNPE